MADASYQPLVYRKQGGTEYVIANGGVLNIETGGVIKTNGTQGAALTTQLTTITHTAATGADYALQDLVSSAGFAFKTKAEGNTFLAVVKNLQTRLAEVEARLEGVGLVAAN